jgi:hypothetical protein
MKKQDNTRIMGRFRFRVFDPERRLLREWTVPNMVVNTGLAWIAGALSGDVADPSLAKYIGIGTGTTAAAADDTALETEVESRATGTQSRITTDTTDDTYKCVGEITMTSSRSITEVGIFTDATAGTLFSRSVFAAEVVGSGNSLEVTYECDIDRP